MRCRPPRISIHALREEGDLCTNFSIRNSKISIHALREEGDVGSVGNVQFSCISIHALREEGDALTSAGATTQFLFLSTPSARRATCGRLWR